MSTVLPTAHTPNTPPPLLLVPYLQGLHRLAPPPTTQVLCVAPVASTESCILYPRHHNHVLVLSLHHYLGDVACRELGRVKLRQGLVTRCRGLLALPVC